MENVIFLVIPVLAILVGYLEGRNRIMMRRIYSAIAILFALITVFNPDLVKMTVTNIIMWPFLNPDKCLPLSAALFISFYSIKWGGILAIYKQNQKKIKKKPKKKKYLG